MTVGSQWLSILLVVVEYFGIHRKDRVPLWAALMYTVVVALYSCFRGDLKRRLLDRQAAAALDDRGPPPPPSPATELPDIGH